MAMQAMAMPGLHIGWCIARQSWRNDHYGPEAQAEIKPSVQQKSCRRSTSRTTGRFLLEITMVTCQNLRFLFCASQDMETGVTPSWAHILRSRYQEFREFASHFPSVDVLLMKAPCLTNRAAEPCSTAYLAKYCGSFFFLKDGLRQQDRSLLSPVSVPFFFRASRLTTSH